MYPYEIFPGFDLYSLCFLIALCSAVLMFRILGDKTGLEVRVHNLSVVSGIVAIAGGYPSALVVQAFYNYLASGTFDITSGMTFYGGLIGGALTFLIVYFIGGRIVDKEKLYLSRFFFVSDLAACSIVVAHAIGRIGCVFAGCCRGAITGAWYGIYNVHLGAKTVPIPLFESLFLFALLAVLIKRVLSGKSYNLPIYLAVYGVWRFFIEYFRFDDRGETFVSFLSPSQLTSLLLILVSVALFIVMIKVNPKKKATANATETDTTESADATSADEITADETAADKTPADVDQNEA